MSEESNFKQTIKVYDILFNIDKLKPSTIKDIDVGDPLIKQITGYDTKQELFQYTYDFLQKISDLESITVKNLVDEKIIDKNFMDNLSDDEQKIILEKFEMVHNQMNRFILNRISYYVYDPENFKSQNYSDIFYEYNYNPFGDRFIDTINDDTLVNENKELFKNPEKEEKRDICNIILKFKEENEKEKEFNKRIVNNFINMDIFDKKTKYLSDEQKNDIISKYYSNIKNRIEIDQTIYIYKNILKEPVKDKIPEQPPETLQSKPSKKIIDKIKYYTNIGFSIVVLVVGSSGLYLYLKTPKGVSVDLTKEIEEEIQDQSGCFIINVVNGESKKLNLLSCNQLEPSNDDFNPCIVDGKSLVEDEKVLMPSNCSRIIVNKYSTSPDIINNISVEKIQACDKKDPNGICSLYCSSLNFFKGDDLQKYTMECRNISGIAISIEIYSLLSGKPKEEIIEKLITPQKLGLREIAKKPLVIGMIGICIFLLIKLLFY